MKLKNLKKYFLGIVFGLWLIPVCAQTNGEDHVMAGEQFGPFMPISIERAIVEEVSVYNNSIMVKITPKYQGKTIVVKISDAHQSQYRYWLNNGKTDFRITTYKSEEKFGYTYRIQTYANFVEYWLDRQLILHLERTGK